MIEQLKAIDNQLFLMLNGSESVYWDGVMWMITKTTTWIPLLLFLICIIARNCKLRRFVFIVLALILTILLADQLSSGLIKPWAMRWRPTHDITFMNSIDTVRGYTGGRYGFVSSHAANTFALFMFLTLLLRSRLMSFCLFFWACLSSYSRIYLGVHFPGDILCGGLLGLMVGLLVYLLYHLVSRKYCQTETPHNLAVYTTAGFYQSDMNLLALVMVVTYLVVLVAAEWPCF